MHGRFASGLLHSLRRGLPPAGLRLQRPFILISACAQVNKFNGCARSSRRANSNSRLQLDSRLRLPRRLPVDRALLLLLLLQRLPLLLPLLRLLLIPLLAASS